MTLAQKEAINPWHYPPHFDFQYGEWLRTDFENGIVALVVLSCIIQSVS